MTIEEAKIKFKKIMEAEWDRLPSHYDSEIGDEVFDDTNQVDELLKLNKIICGALEQYNHKNEDYLTGMEHLADAITYEIDRLDKYFHEKGKNFYESDYYNGIAKGLAEARNAVDRTLSIQLEVKGDKEKAEYFVEEI